MNLAAPQRKGSFPDGGTPGCAERGKAGDARQKAEDRRQETEDRRQKTARTYGYALAGALIATFTVTPVMASILLPEKVKEVETFIVRVIHHAYNPALIFRPQSPANVQCTQTTTYPQ